MGFGWEGKLVRLVPIDLEKHLGNAYRWINDPGSTENTGLGDFPLTGMTERDWLESASKKSDQEVSFAVELLSGEHIGLTGLRAINWKDRSAITGTMIDKEYWGKGYGADAARVRSRYAFEVLGLRYLTSEVQEGNEGSLRMLKKVGYAECGRYPQRLWKRGKFVDEILLYMTREMWERGKTYEQTSSSDGSYLAVFG